MTRSIDRKVYDLVCDERIVLQVISLGPFVGVLSPNRADRLVVRSSTFAIVGWAALCAVDVTRSDIDP